MTLTELPTVTAALVVLTKWYAAHSAVRRLWAFEDSQRLRVIVTLEPTHDGDDIYPAWLANGHEWAHELQLRLDVPVQLEVMDQPYLAEPAGDFDGVLVAALFWRDSSMPLDCPPDDLQCGKSPGQARGTVELATSIVEKGKLLLIPSQ